MQCQTIPSASRVGAPIDPTTLQPLSSADSADASPERPCVMESLHTSLRKLRIHSHIHRASTCGATFASSPGVPASMLRLAIPIFVLCQAEAGLEVSVVAQYEAKVPGCVEQQRFTILGSTAVHIIMQPLLLVRGSCDVHVLLILFPSTLCGRLLLILAMIRSRVISGTTRDGHIMRCGGWLLLTLVEASCWQALPPRHWVPDRPRDVGQRPGRPRVVLPWA